MSNSSESISCVYKGFEPTVTGWQIDIVPADIDPKVFYKNYIAACKPCIINGSIGIQSPSSTTPTTITKKGNKTDTPVSSSISPIQHWSIDNLSKLAGTADVFIEHRDETTRTFGTGIKTIMKFNTFLDNIQNKNTTNLYLTTQPLDWEEDKEEQSSTTNKKKEKVSSPSSSEINDNKAPWKLYASPLHKLTNLFPLRPILLGNLVPSSINLWIGTSSEGSSSNLHHDFHANLYTLLQGKKTFTISSPSNAKYMYTYGRITLIHSNGLINYAGFPTRSDGVPLSLEDEDNDSNENIDDTNLFLDDDDDIDNEKEKTKKSKSKDSTTKKNTTKTNTSTNNSSNDADAMWAALLSSSSSAKLSSSGTKNNNTTTSKRKYEEEDKPSLITDTKKIKSSSNKETNNTKKGNTNDYKSSSNKIPDHFSRIPLPELRTQAINQLNLKLKTSTSTSITSSSSIPAKDILQTIQKLPIIQKQYPLFSKAILTQFTLETGQSLYLPPGWFHEVVSHGGSGNTINTTTTINTNHVHIALNHWYAPPTTNNFNKPYEDNYWEEKFKYSL